MQIERLVFVYDAERGIIGHLKYAFRLLAGVKCELCHITHQGLTEKASWRQCKLDLSVPSDTLYRDEMNAGIAAAVAGDLPAVLAETATGFVKLFGRETLELCAGDVDALSGRLHRALADAGLRLTA